MSKCMLIEATHSEEVRMAIVDQNRLVDFDYESVKNKPIKGNIYLGKIVRIEPSLQAAFVEYGGTRHGFLPFSEIHPDYFRIPVQDREFKEPSLDEGIEIDLQTVPDNDEVSLSAAEIEEEAEVRSFKKESPVKKYKIQEVIQSRQVVLVQVTKEERGGKGAALTTFISLAGRYCVLMPNASTNGGVSRKITDGEDRKRLKELMQELDLPEGMGLIVRTAGMDRSKTEVKRDFKFLLAEWADIRAATLESIAPALVYEEADLVRRSIRDLYARDIDEIFVEGKEAYKTAKIFMKKMMPTHAKRVQLYKEDEAVPLFHKYNIEKQIDSMFQSKVKLKSGGYLVINPTEALVSIDVNSGRATRERHIDSTALKTNLEAAEEVARQLRLRDLAGLIVIDFIDMADPKHNQAVENKLREAISYDRARIQMGRISNFGLMEMSRQRLRPSIFERSSLPCHECHGVGFVRSMDSVSLQLLRVLGEIAIVHKPAALQTTVAGDVGFYLINQKKAEIARLEAQFSIALLFEQDEALKGGFRIQDPSGKVLYDTFALLDADDSGVRLPKKSIHPKPIKTTEDTGDDSPEAPVRKKRRRKKSRAEGAALASPEAKLMQENMPESQEMDPQPAATSTETLDQPARKKRRRPRRRGKGKPDASAPGPNEAGTEALQENTEKQIEPPEEKSQKIDGPRQERQNPRRPRSIKPKAEVLAEGAPDQGEPNTQGQPREARGPRRRGWWKRLLDN